MSALLKVVQDVLLTWLAVTGLALVVLLYGAPLWLGVWFVTRLWCR